MLLFENKLSYIFCVVGVGVTNAEWAWWFVKLNQRCWLACWFMYLCVIFYHVICEIWIICGYVWVRCCRIGDKWVVLFLKCEKLVFVPLLKFSATSQTLSLRHPTHAATSDPFVAQRLWNRSSRAQDGRSPGRSLWVATIPSTVNTAQNIHGFALRYSRFSVDCLLAAPMVVGAAFLMLKCISSYLDCQYDSLGIDKCSKIRHRGPCCEEILTNEEFIMKKKFCVLNDNYIYPLTIIKRNSNLSITHS